MSFFSESKILKLVRYLLMAAAFSPLLAWPNATLDYTLARVLLFCVFVEAALLFYFLLILRAGEERYSPRVTFAAGAYLFFVFFQVASYLGSVDPSRSFWGTMSRSMDGGLFLSLHAAAFFFLLIAVFREEDDWKIFIRFLLGASLFAALIGIYQFFDPPMGQTADILTPAEAGGRIQGPFANPIPFATYLAVALFVFADSFVRPFPRADKRWQWYAAGLTLIIAIVGSLSRGPFIGLVAGSAFVVVLGFIRKDAGVRNVGFGIFLAAIVAMIGLSLASPIVGADPLERFVPLFRAAESGNGSFASSLVADSSVSNRLSAWRIGAQAVLERPFAGWGQEGFSYAFDRFYDPELLTSRTAETWWDRAHNLYLDITVPLGLPALAAYMLFIASVFFEALPALPLLAAGVIVYAVSGLTFFDTLPTTILFLILAAYILAVSRRESRIFQLRGALSQKLVRISGALMGSSSAMLNGLKKGVGAAGILLMLGTLIAGTVLFISISRTNYLMNTTGSLDYPRALEAFERSLSITVPEPIRSEIYYERALYIARAAEAGIIPKGRVQEDLSLARYSALLALVLHQHDVKRLWISAHVANVSAGLSEGPTKEFFASRALGFVERALAISPNRQQVLYEKAQAFFLTGEYSRALDALRLIVDLSPGFPGSHFSLGIGHIGAGEFDQGIAEVELARSLGYAFNRTDAENWIAVAAVYYERKNFDRMIEIYSGLIAAEPSSYYYYQLLAGTYAEMGRYADAEKVARKMCEVDPGTCDAVEQFLQGLPK